MKKIILPGIIAAVATFISFMVLGMIFSFIFPNLPPAYENTAIFRPMNDPAAIILNIIYIFFTGIAFAWAWDKIKEHFKGSVFSRGIKFGMVFGLLFTIPGMIMTLAFFQVTVLMVITWTISGFVNCCIPGWIYAKMNG
jgi:hypothetical protein